MFGMVKIERQVTTDCPRWYVLRWGKSFKVARITAGGAYKLQERGWQLGERVSDSRREAEEHCAELQGRARRFRERQRMLVWEFASVLNQLNPDTRSADRAECSKGSSISRQFDVALSQSVFNGFSLN